MGDKQNVEMTLFYAKDGQWEKIEEVSELTEIHTYVEGKKDFVPDLSEMSMTVNLKIPKALRCKSRKRFIKLLMSKGMRRDCAVWNADMIQKSGLTYGDAWFRLCVLGFGGLA